jgi:hypothetical protein
MSGPVVRPIEFVGELFRELTLALAAVTQSNKEWTARVKHALREMGYRRKLEVYPSPKRWYETEYLLDLIWLDERRTVREGASWSWRLKSSGDDWTMSGTISRS